MQKVLIKKYLWFLEISLFFIEIIVIYTNIYHFDFAKNFPILGQRSNFQIFLFDII